MEYSTDINNESLFDFKVYPIPTNNFLQVEIKSNQEQLPFRMIDLTGRIVKSGQLNQGSNLIQMEELSSGVFFIEIENSGETIARKVIKQ